MGRQPTEPRYREARDTWYVQVDGKQVVLAKGLANKKAAWAEFRRLMAEVAARRSRSQSPATAAGLLVVDLFVAYLRDMRRRRESGQAATQTRADAIRRTAGFVEMHGAMQAAEVRQHHVDAWLETRTAWGPTSRHDGVGAVKSAFRWAARVGHLERNPLAEIEKPKRAGRREAIPTPEQAEAVLGAEMTPQLADILAFLHATGCRPKEARTLEARHLDRANGVAVLAEHKTARKTGRKRVIYIKGPAAEVVDRLAAAHPEGPIFLNSRGSPWTKDALVSAVASLRRRTGLGREVMAYAFRHLFITNGAARGVSAAVLAELAGHADLRMISTYSHLSGRHDVLGEAAEKIGGGGATPGGGEA